MHINVKKMRRSLGMSQFEFGEKIGCAQTNVSFLEKGVRQTSEDTYYKLVKAFGEEFVKRFEEPDLPKSDDGATPREMSELLSMLREQQRQTAETIELLRQSIALLHTMVNK